jgi:hypothetical protein
VSAVTGPPVLFAFRDTSSGAGVIWLNASPGRAEARRYHLKLRSFPKVGGGRLLKGGRIISLNQPLPERFPPFLKIYMKFTWLAEFGRRLRLLLRACKIYFGVAACLSIATTNRSTATYLGFRWAHTTGPLVFVRWCTSWMQECHWCAPCM